jgi:hypothetical protein
MIQHQPGHLVADERVEFGGRNILVLRHPRLHQLDDIERGLDAFVAGDEDFLEVVKRLIINRVFAPDEQVKLAEEARPRLLQPFFETFLFLRPFFLFETI